MAKTTENVNEVKNNENNAQEIKEKDQATPETKSENSTENNSTETAVAVPEKEGLGKKIWNKVKKPLAIAGGIAAGAAALFAAVKIGEAKGFDKACDSFDKLGSDDDPETEGSDLEDISDEVQVTEF